MNLDECYYLGYTSKVHGKQGELIIKLDVDFPEEYKKLESVFIQMNKKDTTLIPFFISNTQVQNTGSLKIKIEDLNSISEAKPLVGKEVYLPLKTLPKLEGNKFYFHEVIGFLITDTNKGVVGKLKQVLEYPTQSIFEVINSDNKEILIPITDDIIVNVDRTKETIEVNTPDGLIDLYLE